MTSRFFTRWRPHVPLFAMATGVFAMLAFTLGYEGCDAPCSDWDVVDDLLLQETADHKIRRRGHSPLVVVTDGNSAEFDMARGSPSDVSANMWPRIFFFSALYSASSIKPWSRSIFSRARLCS